MTAHVVGVDKGDQQLENGSGFRPDQTVVGVAGRHQETHHYGRNLALIGAHLLLLGLFYYLFNIHIFIYLFIYFYAFVMELNIYLFMVNELNK